MLSFLVKIILYCKDGVRVLTFVNFVYMRGGMCVRDEAV